METAESMLPDRVCPLGYYSQLDNCTWGFGSSLINHCFEAHGIGGMGLSVMYSSGEAKQKIIETMMEKEFLSK